MKTHALARLAAWTLVAVLAGCNTEPRPGIEIGNPDLDEATLRIVPAAGNEFYQIQIVDEATASVDQFQKASSGPILLDSINTDYTRAGSNVVLQVSFSNERDIDVNASLAEDGQVQSVFIKVDGLPMESCFDDPELAPACDTSIASVTSDPGQETQSGLTEDAVPENAQKPLEEGTDDEGGQETEKYMMQCDVPFVDGSGTISFESCTPTPPYEPKPILGSPDTSLLFSPFGIFLSPAPLFLTNPHASTPSGLGLGDPKDL